MGPLHLFVPLQENFASKSLSKCTTSMLQLYLVVVISMNIPKYFKWRFCRGVSSLSRQVQSKTSFLFFSPFLRNGTFIYFRNNTLRMLNSNAIIDCNIIKHYLPNLIFFHTALFLLTLILKCYKGLTPNQTAVINMAIKRTLNKVHLIDVLYVSAYIFRSDRWLL